MFTDNGYRRLWMRLAGMIRSHRENAEALRATVPAAAARHQRRLARAERLQRYLDERADRTGRAIRCPNGGGAYPSRIAADMHTRPDAVPAPYRVNA